jgi:hypothetical protein
MPQVLAVEIKLESLGYHVLGSLVDYPGGEGGA